MITYDDLTLEDVAMYWGSGSVLLLPRGGTYTACRAKVDAGNPKYPIHLYKYATDERIISMRLSTFVTKVLCHHPSMGYADYNGIPVYVSSTAARGARKAVDTGNLTMYLPASFYNAITEKLEDISRRAKVLVNRGDNVDALSREYARWSDGLRQTAGRGGGNGREISIIDKSSFAAMLEQCVNNNYPSLEQALARLRENKHDLGVSLSREFALVRTRKEVFVLHRKTVVGTLNTETRQVEWTKALSTHAIMCLSIMFNRLRGTA